MNSTQHQNIVGFIWNIANKLLACIHGFDRARNKSDFEAEIVKLDKAME